MIKLINNAYQRVRRIAQLPLSLADFSKRGFRLDRPVQLELLEGHCRSFLTGFNLAVTNWHDIHTALAGVADEERGFAYEGAGMYAGLRDLLTISGAHARQHLLSGPGQQYIHMVHVGTGWGLAPIITPLHVRTPARLPSTPLLRWLAVDGAGFAEVIFGAEKAFYRSCRRKPTLTWQSRIAGCGRALWFLQSADVEGIADVIDKVPEPARPHLWSGIGLAVAYAGSVDDDDRDRLAKASGKYRPYLAQGVVFAAAARQLSTIVPAHTERACEQLLSVSSARATEWGMSTTKGLEASPSIEAYLEWKARIRALATDNN